MINLFRSICLIELLKMSKPKSAIAVLFSVVFFAGVVAGRRPHVINFRSHNLFPESFTWDPRSQHFIAGSLRHPKLVSVSDAGVSETLISDASLPPDSKILGIALDRSHYRVLAVVHRPPSPDSPEPYNALAAYDLISLRRLFVTPLIDDGDENRNPNYIKSAVNDEDRNPNYIKSAVNDEDRNPYRAQSAANNEDRNPNYIKSVVNDEDQNPNRAQFVANDEDRNPNYIKSVVNDEDRSPNRAQSSVANDVATDFDGNAYVTDSGKDLIWKVKFDGEATVLSRSNAFKSHPTDGQKSGLNGVVYNSKGYLLVVQSNTGKLFKVDVDNGSARTVILNKDLTAADGLAVRKDGVVVAVSRRKLYFLKSPDSWMEGVVFDETALEEDRFASAVTVGNEDRVYVLYGHIHEGMMVNVERDEFGIMEIESEKENSEDKVWIFVLVGLGLAYFMFWRFQMRHLVENMNKKRV